MIERAALPSPNLYVEIIEKIDNAPCILIFIRQKRIVCEEEEEEKEEDEKEEDLSTRLGWMDHSIRGEQLIPRNRRMDNAETKKIE